MPKQEQTRSGNGGKGSGRASSFDDVPKNIQGDDLVIMPPPGGHSDFSESALPSPQHTRHNPAESGRSGGVETQGKRDRPVTNQTRSARSAQLHSTFGMGGNTSALQLNDDKVDQMMHHFEHHDEEEGAHMTLGRRIVEKFLYHRKWYNPQYVADRSPTSNNASASSSTPNLRHAWAYFEHITLPRRFVHPGDGTSKYDRADPGEIEEETILYSPWKLPESEISQWGIGMGLYFKTLHSLAFIFLVVGLVNIVNMLFFMSSNYSPEKQSSLRLIFQGTAICTNRQWVQCLDCTSSQWDIHPTAFATDAAGNVFVERNACQNGATVAQGMVNYASILFLVVALIAMGFYQKRTEQKLDEDLLSATDYSICVRNPPPDARDPEVWRDFFNQFEDDNKKVTFVTIALGNSELIYALMERRHLRRKLQIMLGSHVNLDKPDEVNESIRSFSPRATQQTDDGNDCWSKFCNVFKKRLLNPFGLALTDSQMYDKLEKMDAKIRKLQKKEYPVVKVFVTFETEAGQRNALAALSTSKLNKWLNRTAAVGDTVAFEGKVLEIVEPREPSAVRWQDLGFPTWKKIVQRCVTAAIIAGVIVLDVFIIYISRQDVGPQFAAIVISFFNLLIPMLCHWINMVERHSTEGGYQTSLFSKIAVFRWFNSALVVMLITPFTRSLTGGEQDLLPQIGIILFYELWLTPLLNYMDLHATFLKHYKAPRCRTQEAMNGCFRGSSVTLAERYTDFMKVMLLACFYSPLYPSSFLFAAASFALQYMVDKFRLVRAWARQPVLGSQLASFVQTYFFSTVMVIVFISSSFFWSGFTFDNVCVTNQFSTISGQQQVILGTGEIVTISIDDNLAFKFCSQDLFRSEGWNFPPTPNRQPENSEWMTNDQTFVTRIVGWTSVVVIAVWAFWVFGGTLTNAILSLVKGTYKDKSRDMKIDFCNIQEVDAYVPQIVETGMNFPILLCDVDDIDPELIGWRDTRNGYDKHNIFLDLPRKRKMKRVRLVNEEGNLIDIRAEDYMASEDDLNNNKITPNQKLFSTVRHWPAFPDDKAR